MIGTKRKGQGETVTALKAKTKDSAKKPKTKKDDKLREHVTITAPNFKTAAFTIRGDAPLVQCKFSEKAKRQIHIAQEAGSTRKKGTKKEPKNFQEDYEASMHRSADGKWYGLPASGLRKAMVSACRVCGFTMTLAKLCVFIEADGYSDDGTPLVKLTKGSPHYAEHYVRIQQTVDLRARGMWDPGWEAVVRVRFDADQFTTQDIAHLMMRVGIQVGICEGRPDSKNSCGMGWGTFDTATEGALA